MIDYRIILLCLMVLIFFSLLCGQSDTGSMVLGETPVSETPITPIRISDETYEKMVDIVTGYSMMSQNHDEKMILVYLSTFHLFDMNYGYLSIRDIDEKISKYPYYPNNTKFPEGNMHHNLQKAIITHITLQVANAERELVHDKEKDRQVIDIYLNNLFTGIGIM